MQMMQIDVFRLKFYALYASEISSMKLREESLAVRVVVLERATSTNERADVKSARANVDIVSARVCVCARLCVCAYVQASGKQASKQ